MATTVEKIILSGSTDGKGVLVTGTATGSANTIHTAHATAEDEVWIYAHNSDSSDRTLTIEFGGATDPGNVIELTIVSQATNTGLVLAVPGLILSNSLIVKAFASTGSQITLFGYINRINQ